MRIYALSSVIVVIALAGCMRIRELTGFRDSSTQQPGSIHRVEQICSYRPTTLHWMLRMGGPPEPIDVQYGARLYRIRYWTRCYDGKPTIVSGLVSLPKTNAIKGVVSYQHATSSIREYAPSHPNHEGVLGSAVFAGGGYIYVAADYIGLGQSFEMHPYMHAETTACTVVDLLKATHEFVEREGIKWPAQLFLTGSSQGGHATMAVHRKLESLNDPRFQVTACAPASGSYNLSEVGFRTALEGKADGHPFYLAYMANAYSVIYGHPIRSIVNEPYCEKIPKLFDGHHQEDEPERVLPRTSRELFTKEFLADYDAARPTWLLSAIAENDVHAWAPKAPVRMYYGKKDQDVSPTDSEKAAESMTKLGGNVIAVCTGEHDHLQSILHAVSPIREWFDEVASK
jgi:hypothetical protein